MTSKAVRESLTNDLIYAPAPEWRTRVRLVLAGLADELDETRNANRGYVKAVDKYLGTFRSRLAELAGEQTRIEEKHSRLLKELFENASTANAAIMSTLAALADGVEALEQGDLAEPPPVSPLPIVGHVKGEYVPVENPAMSRLEEFCERLRKLRNILSALHMEGDDPGWVREAQLVEAAAEMLEATYADLQECREMESPDSINRECRTVQELMNERAVKAMNQKQKPRLPSEKGGGE